MRTPKTCVWLTVLGLAIVFMPAADVTAGDSWFAVASDGKTVNVGSQRAAAPEVSVHTSTHQVLGVTIETQGLSISPRKTKGGEFVRVDWPGAARFGEIGAPRLPVVRKVFIAPPGATVTISTTTGNGIVIGSDMAGRTLRLLPQQRPVPKIPGALENAPFEFDEDAYSLDMDTPTERATVEEAGIVRGQRLFLLTAYPVAYNPARQVITYYPDISVEIRFDEAAPSACAPSPMPGLDNIVLNPEVLPAGPRDASDYLIIVADTFASGIASFATFKEGQGYDVTVTPLSAVPGGSSNTQIKAYIESLWETAEEPAYILLVGDTDTIAHWTGGGEGSPATDLPYACMDGSGDWYPDIAIGRFPARTPEHLTAMIDKTISLESGVWADPAYAERACFMASVDNYEISEGTHNYVIDTHLDDAGIVSDRLYQVTYGADTQDVRDSFNGGRVYGIYSGHGGTYSWGDGPPFSQDDVRGLTNNQMYPLVCSFSCITGTYTVDECFVETWIREANKGAATIYGSSVNSYWTEDDWLERDLFDAIYFDEVREVSPAWQAALVRYLTHGGGEATTRRYYEMYNLMGDPSLYLPEPGGGADLRVTPTGGLTTEGMAGGPFDPESLDYVLINNADVPIGYSVSANQTWVDITNATGTIPVGCDAQVTVSLGAEAYGFGQGHYEATVAFTNTTTGDGDTTRGVVLDVGRTIINVAPSYGLETGGPEDKPFTGSVTYTVTSERPTPVDVEITANQPWISLNGVPGPLSLTLTGTGDFAEVIVGISTEAESLDVGIYNGSVNYTNLTSGEGDTSRDVLLEVGRVLYSATDVPQAIGDSSAITSTIDVTDAYCVGDVNVDMDITHTYIGDLTLDLTSPGGVTVRLHNRTGGTEEDIVTTYDEEGGTMPDGPGSLADFNYGGVTGIWTLTVEDHAGGDTGTLNGWVLGIVPPGDPCPPVAHDIDIEMPVDNPIDITLDAESIEGNPLTYSISSLPDFGTLVDPGTGLVIDMLPYTLVDDGDVVTYDPTNGYSGPDMFSYRGNDGLDSNKADVNITVGAPVPVHLFHMDADPGWTVEGDWAFGVPQGIDGDPSSGATGTNVYGYNLAGEYTDGMSATYLTTLPIDCSPLTMTELHFERWLGVESATYDHATVEISNNGMDWTVLWDHAGATFTDTAWLHQEFDIAAIADGQPTVYIRWSMGPTDGSQTYCGWNIDDVEIWGIAAPGALQITCPAGVPALVPSGEPTDITVQILEGGEQYVPDSAMLHYRYDGGAYVATPLTPLGGELYRATLPAPACGDTPEFYFSAQGSESGVLYEPSDAPATTFTANVGVYVLIMQDDFETDQGWTVENIDLTGGAWERGVPIADPGDGYYAPLNDYDGSGQCYLTENALQADIDGGPTRLISPMIDLSATSNPVLQYARWWFNDDHDGDPLDVEISNDGGENWTLIERVMETDPEAPPTDEWVERTIFISDYVTPTAQVMIRFGASDVPNNSKNEGGIDAIRLDDIYCGEVACSIRGDLTGDGTVDGADIQAFSDCHIGGDPGAPGCICADIDESGAFEAADVSEFVTCLLDAVCP